MAQWARTNANLLANIPAGFPGVFLPGEETPTGELWWMGSDRLDRLGSSALSMPPAVTRCLTVLTEGVVRTLWAFTDRAGNLLPRPLWVEDPQGLGALPGILAPLLPIAERVDGHRFYSNVLADAILHGRGFFAYMESQADRSPLAGSLMRLNPYLVGEEHGRWVLDDQLTDMDGRLELGGRTWRVMCVRGMSPDNRGVLERHHTTLRLGVHMETYMRGSLRSGVPAGYLTVSTPNYDEAEAAKLKTRWMAQNGGDARSIAVLNSSVTFSPLTGISPVDAEAERLAHYNRSEIALCFGLDPIWAGEGAGGLTYSNATDRRRDLVDLTLAGWGESLTSTLTACLPGGQAVSVNWGSFASPSLEVLVPPLVAAVEAGIVTVEEARNYLHLPPINPAPVPVHVKEPS